MEDSKGSGNVLLDMKKVLPAIVTGVVISVGTQILLDWVRPRLGIKVGK